MAVPDSLIWPPAIWIIERGSPQLSAHCIDLCTATNLLDFFFDILVVGQPRLKVHVVGEHPQQEGSFGILHCGTGRCKHAPSRLALLLGLGEMVGKKKKGLFLSAQQSLKARKYIWSVSFQKVSSVSLESFMTLAQFLAFPLCTLNYQPNESSVFLLWAGISQRIHLSKRWESRGRIEKRKTLF